MRRGIAAFLGVFTLINCVGEFFVHDFDANIWWIRSAPLPLRAAHALLFAAGIFLLAFASGFPKNRVLRHAGAAILIIVAAFTLANSAEFFALAAQGRIHPWVPIPMTAIVTAAIAWIATALIREPTSPSPRFPVQGLATAAALVVAFPLAQMFFFGTTDYRRSADVAVVLGARTYADGRASQALADRVKTAVELYRQGLAKRLIFSGGPGDGTTSEPQAMRRIAIESGIPNRAIFLDEAGLNTDATVRNTVAAFSQLKVHRVLVVSHAYHLPRVKLAYQRAGWDVRTVPARQSRRLRNEPVYIAREVVALWAYYLRPIVCRGLRTTSERR
jgi:vancomycin permeability regulator SanA